MNAVQIYDKVQFNIPIAESLLYNPWPLEDTDVDYHHDHGGFFFLNITWETIKKLIVCVMPTCNLFVLVCWPK